MGTSIVILAGFGVLLMILETFLPGMVTGILGLLCSLSAVVLLLVADDFSHWSGWLRAASAGAVILGTSAILLLWLRFFAVKFWHRAFTLETAIASATPATNSLSPGTRGIALTELRPLGRADFQGTHRDVRCEDGFAPAGSTIQVSGSEPGNLRVRIVTL